MAPWYLNRHQRGSSSRRFHHDTPISTSSETSSPCPGSDRPPAISPALNDSSGDSSTDYDGSPSRHRRPFHVRPLSNPFPSLFRGNKRKERKCDSAAEALSHAGFPCDDFYLPWSPEAAGVQGDQDPDNMKEFASGNCMTCGSTMRWPKELDVFKCSICVTINDLVPLGTRGARERRPRGQDDTVSKISSTE
jgi:E3 ubiquitin-protein ligase HECTD2